MLTHEYDGFPKGTILHDAILIQQMGILFFVGVVKQVGYEEEADVPAQFCVTCTNEGDGFWDVIDQIDYPSYFIADNGGIPQDTQYNYVSSTFLDGLVNYINAKRCFIVNQYGLDDHNEAPITYDQAAEKLNSMAHTRLLAYDSCFVFGETDMSYWWLWYDCDVSDCCILRCNKGHFSSFGSFIDFILKDTSDRYCGGWKHTDQPNAIYTKFTPRGWLQS